MSKVYVGNLDPDATDRDLEKEFDRFGKIGHIWIARKPPGFAFVTYEDERDAQDACAEMNGKTILAQRVRVEISAGGGRGGGGRGFGGRGRDRYDDRDRYGGGRDRGGDRYGGGGRDRSRSPPRRRRSDSRERRPRRSPSPLGRRDDAPPARSRSPAVRGRSPSPAARRSPSPRGRSRSP